MDIKKTRKKSVAQQFNAPEKLYKYRAFDTNTLRILTQNQIYFSSPESFNDPFDCKPRIDFEDRNTEIATSVLLKFLNQRNRKAITMRTLREMRYSSGSPDENEKTPTQEQQDKTFFEHISSAIEKNLLYDINQKGVFCLAEKWDCPLMWSHYADEHRGICIEFNISENEKNDVYPVDYESLRTVQITDLEAWKLYKSKTAEKRVLKNSFYTKSQNWSYEKEWRVIRETFGAQQSPFRISGIYFGLRCDHAVKCSIVKLLKDAEEPIEFYEIAEKRGTFDLAKVDASIYGEFQQSPPLAYIFRNCDPVQLKRNKKKR